MHFFKKFYVFHVVLTYTPLTGLILTHFYACLKTVNYFFRFPLLSTIIKSVFRSWWFPRQVVMFGWLYCGLIMFNFFLQFPLFKNISKIACKELMLKHTCQFDLDTTLHTRVFDHKLCCVLPIKDL